MRQKRLHSILFTLFLSCCLLLIFAIINIIENCFSLLDILLIVITLTVGILIGKRLPEDMEERGSWTDDETLVFTEIIEFRNDKIFVNKTEISVHSIQFIYLIREGYSWTLCLKSLKSVNYIERIIFSEKEIIDKLVKKGFFDEKDYFSIVYQPRTFKLKVIDYFDFIGFPKFELYKNEKLSTSLSR